MSIYVAPEHVLQRHRGPCKECLQLVTAVLVDTVSGKRTWLIAEPESDGYRLHDCPAKSKDAA